MAGTLTTGARACQSEGARGKTADVPSFNIGILEQPLFLLLLIGSLLAVSTICAKAAPGIGWHPVALLQWSVLRRGGQSVCLHAPFLRGTLTSRSVAERPGRGKLLRYVVVTGLLFITPNMIAVAAAPKVGAGFVSLCYAFPLVLTYAFAMLLRMESFQILRASGVLLGLARWRAAGPFRLRVVRGRHILVGSGTSHSGAAGHRQHLPDIAMARWSQAHRSVVGHDECRFHCPCNLHASHGHSGRAPQAGLRRRSACWPR